MRGVWTALITPFNSSNELDLPAFRKILKDQRDAGVAGVVPCGTTGETPALSVAEKKTLIRVTLEEMKGSGVGVMAGTGSNSTAETIEFSKWASDQGVDSILVVTPYYNKPSQAGLEAHFRAVTESVNCDVVLYNVPGRTGVSLNVDTIVRLASLPKIRAIKEATGNVAFTCEIIDQLNVHRETLTVLSGDDATFLPMLSVGAQGVISVSSNLFPRAMVAIQKAAEQGNLTEAMRLHKHFYPLFRDLFVESNPVPIKEAMAHAGFCGNSVRAPLAPLSEASQKKLDASLKQCGVVSGRPL